jgi:energy-coupling factor transport system substrate-specific component
MSRYLSGAIYLLSGVIGLGAFAYPFFLPAAQLVSGDTFLSGTGAPLLTLMLLTLCLAALLVETQGEAVSAKFVATLGMLVAVTSVLRFIEVAIPGPGGFSPIFVPIILAGYVFGGRFGFLMGSLTLLASALITGGVGPWLPYQMFTAGWVGLTAGWLPHLKRPYLEVALLALFSLLWGILYGAVMNVYFWPFIAGQAALSWQPGAGWQAALTRYLAFYLATSLLWDLARGLGNVVFMLAVGLPVLRTLVRFRTRFHFEVQPS